MSVPIQNIYYLLCYAWNQLEQGQLVSVATADCENVADLLAHVLVAGTTRLFRRGLDRGYVEETDVLGTVRGRIEVGPTVRNMLRRKGRVQCVYDEFRYDILHNRLLKSTLRRLALVKGLDSRLRRELVGLYRRMTDVCEVALTPQIFRRVQLNRNNAYYGFLMNVCELAVSLTMADERTGDYRFLDFLREERHMAMLFQQFVYNFLAREQSDYAVGRDRFRWDASTLEPDASDDLRYLPDMETDITLRSAVRTIVIDTKYYQETLTSSYGGHPKVHSENLYQLHSYLSNLESRASPDANAEGILLYPDTRGKVSLSYRIRGHVVHVKTVNLCQDWAGISKDLLKVLPTEDTCLGFDPKGATPSMNPKRVANSP